MKSAVRLSLLLLLAGARCLGAELTPFLQDNQIGVLVTNARIPEALAKDLTSGLTNRILIRLELLEGSNVLQRRAVEVAIRYDLWDENFAATTSVDGIAAGTRTHGSMEEVKLSLAQLRLPAMFRVGNLSSSSEFAMRADVLFNPIDRERMELIRKWVAENSTYTPLDPSGAVAGPSNASSMSNAIFNRIFEQYASGSEVAAAWRETVSTAPFRLDELGNERR